MHRVLNYGSFMQAFAMKRLVEAYGHEATFCDFRNGQPRHHGSKAPGENWTDKLRKIPTIALSPGQYLAKRYFRKQLKKCFEQQAWPLLGVRMTPDYDTRCDLMIIGSDEVFNYTQNQTFGYVPELFGHDLKAKTIVAFAASAGYTTLRDIENDGIGSELAGGFARFASISVRDGNTFEIVSTLAPKPPELVIDPTLIYDFTNDLKPTDRMPGYLLIYAYEGRLDSPEEVRAIRTLAAEKCLRILSIGAYHVWCDENIVAAPLELLSLFANAECIITDTFHGTIFSIKNRRPFVSLIRGENRWGSNSNKLTYLLQQLGLEHRINRELEAIGRQLDEPIHYDCVTAKLAPLQDASRGFLERALLLRG